MHGRWLLAFTLLPGCAMPQARMRTAAPTQIPTAGTILAPAGFLALCARGDAACVSSPDDPAMIEPDRARATLERVNRLVNRKVRRVADTRAFGQDEYWIRSGAGRGARGDCEDMALEKRALLLDAGLPASALALAVVHHPRIGRHAVLVVRSRQGDLVLDSRSPYIHGWYDTPYQWLSLQANGPQPELWSRVIDDGRRVRLARRTASDGSTAALR